MFIDDKGKLFGKISLVDIALVLLIIAAGIFVGFKFLGGAGSDVQMAECTYVVKIENIKETSLKFIKSGDKLFNENDAFMGVIAKDPEYTVATDIAIKNDGSYTVSEKQGRVDVWVTIKGEGIKSSNGFYLDGKVALLLGTDRFFKDESIDFKATVVEIIE